jgi:hypothetical protein
VWARTASATSQDAATAKAEIANQTSPMPANRVMAADDYPLTASSAKAASRRLSPASRPMDERAAPAPMWCRQASPSTDSNRVESAADPLVGVGDGCDTLTTVLVAIYRRLLRWRGRLALLWALLTLCAVIAAAHVPASSVHEMDGAEHMGGAALCLAVLTATGLLVVLVARPPCRPVRPARRLGRALSPIGFGPVLPPARAGPLSLQVLRL